MSDFTTIQFARCAQSYRAVPCDALGSSVARCLENDGSATMIGCSYIVAVASITKLQLLFSHTVSVDQSKKVVADHIATVTRGEPPDNQQAKIDELHRQWADPETTDGKQLQNL